MAMVASQGDLPSRVVTGRSGLFATIEDPATIRRLTTLVSLSAVVSTAGFAALFFVFDEQVAGWATLVLALAYLVAWLTFVGGRLLGRMVVVVAVTTAVAVVNHQGDSGARPVLLRLRRRPGSERGLALRLQAGPGGSLVDRPVRHRLHGRLLHACSDVRVLPGKAR